MKAEAGYAHGRHSLPSRRSGKNRCSRTADWQPLTPVEMKSAGGATLKAQDDGSILVSGENPNQGYVHDCRQDRPGRHHRPAAGDDSRSVAAASGSAARSPGGDFRLTRYLSHSSRREYVGHSRDRPFRADRIAGQREDAVAGRGAGLRRQRQRRLEGHREAVERRLRRRGEAGDRRQHERPLLRSRIRRRTPSIEANPWWEVDLGSDKRIERISVWNRTDGGDAIGSRLAGYKVAILDAERKVVWQQSPADFPKPEHRSGRQRRDKYRLRQKPSPTIPPMACPSPASSKCPPIPKAGWGVGVQRDKPHWAVFVAAAPLHRERQRSSSRSRSIFKVLSRSNRSAASGFRPRTMQPSSIG